VLLSTFGLRLLARCLAAGCPDKIRQEPRGLGAIARHRKPSVRPAVMKVAVALLAAVLSTVATMPPASPVTSCDHLPLWPFPRHCQVDVKQPYECVRSHYGVLAQLMPKWRLHPGNHRNLPRAQCSPCGCTRSHHCLSFALSKSVASLLLVPSPILL